MKALFRPSLANGTVKAPPSKSASHRALICASLSPDLSILHGLGRSDDLSATVGCLRALGTKIELDGDTAYVRGFAPFSARPKEPLFCMESGSTLRFLLPLALLSGYPVTFTGSERLFSRSLGVYEDLAKTQEFTFEKNDRSLTVRGPLHGGQIVIDGSESSQFASGLLFALPLLPEDTVLAIIPPVVSAPYIALTFDTLSRFGIVIETIGGNLYRIRGGQKYRACETDIEGDHSNGAYLKAVGLLSENLSVTGLDENSVQGDKVCGTYFDALRRGFAEFALDDCPDLAPILLAVSALYHGGRFTGTARLSGKESDRVSAMKEELAKFGASLVIGNDSVTVERRALHAPSSSLSGHGDHRIVMALSLLLSRFGGEIEGAEAVSKSYPSFFEDLSSLGIEVVLREDERKE